MNKGMGLFRGDLKESAMNSRTQAPTSHAPSGGVMHYGEHNFEAERGDPYQATGKYKQPVTCSSCGAVYDAGRWTWGAAPPDAQAATCPACRRIHDKLPAGSVVAEGPFVGLHRDDLVHLIRNEAERESREHPMNRLVEVRELPDRLEVMTTDIHLPRRIGTALKRAYDGELDIRFAENEYSVRVLWQR
jgi:hypothetical protein